MVPAVLAFGVAVIGLGCGSRKPQDIVGGTGGGSVIGTGGGTITGTGGRGVSGTGGSGGGRGVGGEGTGGGQADGGGDTDAQAGDDAAATDSSRCPGTSAQPGRRPQAVACPPTNVPQFSLPDAGPISCTTTADCQVPNGLTWGCLQGTCSVDQCLTDDDCASGMACGCAADFGGNAVHTNLCVLAQCRVDADCGQDGACAPSRSGRCGSLTGYYCHSPADTCASNADCNCDPARTLCLYQPTLGHWACQALVICNG